MQLKLFTMPVFGGEAVEDELNKFLRSHRVLQLERHYCSDNGGYWAMLVEYADGDPIAEAPPQTRQPRDVTAGMSDEEKQRYNMFRDIRKDLAQQKACPAYLVFTNEELAILARQPELTDDSVKGLKLSMHQPIINRTKFGIPFLGYVVYKDQLRLTQRSRHRFKIKMKRLAADLDAGRISQEEYTMRAQCLTSYVAKADTMGFRHHLEDTIEGIYPQGL